MTILRSLTIASLLAVSTATLLLAQGGREGRGGGQGGQPPRNLQVLPKEMSRAELTPIMRGIAVSLGVRCNYCHVVTSPATPEPAGGGGRGGGEQFDYALDDKETKKTAREMLRMVMDINEKYLPAMGRTLTARNRVTCETCHHGLAKPQSLVNALAGAVEAKGADSAVALYRDLRTRYFGRAAYDFGELSLQDAATEVGRMPNQRPAAIALLKLNLEFYPQSVPSFAALAQHSVALGDTAGAVEALNRGLAVQPDNQQLRNMLNRIRPPR
jgi:hypothetical protein